MKSQKIRDSARGEACTLQIAGVCNGDTETTVLCHFPDESNGMGTKSDDISAGYGCSSCHLVADGVENTEWEVFHDFYMRRSQKRTLDRLIEKGIVIIKGYK